MSAETYAYWQSMAEHHEARMNAVIALPSWRRWRSLCDERMHHSQWRDQLDRLSR